MERDCVNFWLLEPGSLKNLLEKRRTEPETVILALFLPWTEVTRTASSPKRGSSVEDMCLVVLKEYVSGLPKRTGMFKWLDLSRI